MTTELNLLRARLNEVFSLPIDLPAVPKTLNEELERLKKFVNDGGSGKPARDRMQEAITDFRRTGELKNLGQARLTCFGCTEKFKPTLPMLIEDREAFPLLLKEVDKYRGKPRAFRRCYRGLLNSYFQYDQDFSPADSAGLGNWRRLQEYLLARVRNIHVDEMQPDWVATVEDHKNLLTQDPVSRYGTALLRGDSSEFQAIRNRLEIDADSWVLRKVVLAQVRAAVAQPDEQFHQFVDGLLTLLNEHRMQRDEGLGLVLDRYAAMQIRPEHDKLRDAAIDAWGSPWMTTRNTAWQRVKPESRAMVHSWLNLKLIQQFFDVLSEDRHTDKRRVKFWQQFHEDIEEIYFALGSAAANSRSADIRQLRKDMGTHLLILRGGGPRNNAFIMRIGSYVLVEFGLSGNACYIFRSKDLPFQLRGELACDGTGLKHDSRKVRLLHMDGSAETWEDKFEDALRKLGIRPHMQARLRETTVPRDNVATDPSYKEQATERRHDATTAPAPRRFSMRALRDFCEAHGFPIDDRTSAGGRLWVLKAPEVGAVAEQLFAWGFRRVALKGAWYRVISE